MSRIKDRWDHGDQYEYFMGRWSSSMAQVFLKWLDLPPRMNWLDVGCGTGALSQAIEQNSSPLKLSCIDPAEGFIEKAKKRISSNCDIRVGSAEKLPYLNDSFDAVVSGLALNFFPDLKSALSEMKRVLKSNGMMAAYVWDYSGRMEFLRYFWDAAFIIDPKSRDFDEGLRFPVCKPENLSEAFKYAGLKEVEVSFLDIATVFLNFDDYWNPFLGGQGPAPGFLMSLDDKSRNELKEQILERIDYSPDGSIRLIARALVVKGIK